ncbi:subtilisin-like serine protease QhpE [Marinobacterium arenosum]|uniref:subtilisin-like serine protease QhpE n=1 Tax=Marinobacterium arenosum TaxID=2862496 RepID=UPI001C939B40|nr:S8 family serine peptidase [Marinobacterium arenosum]MBY4676625.1 peptidase S8/S53 subtilisin kexin sedolisin [Marinobacterium arenosum]
MAEQVHVGIVDSGYSARQQPQVDSAMRYFLDDCALWQGEPQPDQLLHGSRILDVIAAQAPRARFAVAQVFDERFTTTPVQVAAAIDWLVAEGVQLINLSLGLLHDREALAEACRRAANAGVILCASSPAKGDPVYPASYPDVIRMTGDARCAPGQWSCLETRYADFGGHVRSLDGESAGASIGTAFMSGHLARYLAEGGEPAAAAARDWLRQHASFYGAEQRRA